jgi:hypothetical protein
VLYCDGYDREGAKPDLFLAQTEQPQMLRAAGFGQVELLRDEGGMALYRGR